MDIKEYSRMVNDFAWYGTGDIIQIAKAAKKFGRNYMDDIAEAKKQVIEYKGQTIFDYVIENQEEVKKAWGGQRKGAGRPKKLPTPKDSEMRRSHSIYASEPEMYFVKKMLEALRSQRDFTEAERNFSFAKVIEIYRSAQFEEEEENG